MKRIERINKALERNAAQLYEITEAGWTAGEINTLIEGEKLTQAEAVAIVMICRSALANAEAARNATAKAAAIAAVKAEDEYEAQCEYDAAWVAAYDSYDAISTFRALCLANNNG